LTGGVPFLLTEVSMSSGRKRRLGGGSARAILSGFFSSSLTLLCLVLDSSGSIGNCR